jgi:hypothetical protein
MFTITTAVATAVKGHLHAFFHKPEQEPTVTLLEFTDQQVTTAVQAGVHVFEWDGTKGLVSDYVLKETAGEWKLRIITHGTTGTKGFVTASPTGRRTLSIYKKAKCKQIAEMGFSMTFAKIYISRARNIHHYQTDEVIKWVGNNYLMSEEVLQTLQGSNIGSRNIQGVCNCTTGISQSKLHAAIKIIGLMRSTDPVITYVAENLKAMQSEVLHNGSFCYKDLSPEEKCLAKHLVARYPVFNIEQP